jgi:hypothetical protein
MDRNRRPDRGLNLLLAELGFRIEVHGRIAIRAPRLDLEPQPPVGAEVFTPTAVR